MSLETAQKVIVPQKKIMSRIFLNSGTLIVKIRGRFNFKDKSKIYKKKSAFLYQMSL
jgi:hypothetical protein